MSQHGVRPRVAPTRAAAGLSLCLALAACGDPRVNEVSTKLLLEPEVLEFGTVSRGASAIVELRVTNQARAAVEVEILAEAPLSAEGARIGGGASEALPVTFRSLALGPHEGTLRVSSGSFTREVRWTALVAEPSTCASSPACQESVIDPETGACAWLAAPDQQPCSLAANACGVEGRCQQGACVPSITGCDDANACTRDQCDAALGCTHADVAGECPGTSDPCLSTACDPTAGCVQLPANEGGACGTSDCVERHVCRGGSCVAEPTPDGVACLQGSPCQTGGTCRAGSCEGAAEAPLVLRWEHPLSNPFFFWNGFSGGGVTDASGRLFWADCEGTSCWIRGAELTGPLRFTVQVEEVERLMVIGRPAEQRLLLVTHSGRLQVRSLSDGSLEWELDLAPSAELHATPSQQAEEPPVWLGGFHAVATESQAWVSVTLDSPIWFTNELEHRGSALIAIDLERRRVLWTKGGGRWAFPVLDDEGHLHAMENGALVSYEADGGVRYRGAAFEEGLWGTVGPHLLVERSLRSTADGSLVRSGLFETSAPSWLVASASSVWRTEEDTLERISLVDGRVEWRAAAGASVQRVQLRVARLSEERVLVNAYDVSDGGARPLAVGFDALGNRWSCGFPGLARGGVIAIADGLIYVAGVTCDSCGDKVLRAYELPGVAPARDGWAHYDGDFSRARGDTW